MGRGFFGDLYKIGIFSTDKGGFWPIDIFDKRLETPCYID
jgi:hypothetical protein